MMLGDKVYIATPSLPKGRRASLLCERDHVECLLARGKVSGVMIRNVRREIVKAVEIVYRDAEKAKTLSVVIELSCLVRNRDMILRPVGELQLGERLYNHYSKWHPSVLALRFIKEQMTLFELSIDTASLITAGGLIVVPSNPPYKHVDWPKGVPTFTDDLDDAPLFNAGRGWQVPRSTRRRQPRPISQMAEEDKPPADVIPFRRREAAG